MAISFNNAVGNLFNRLGALGELLRELRVFQAAVDTDMTDPTTGAMAQLVAEPDVQATIGNSYLNALAAAGSVASLARTTAEQVANRVVFRDNPRIGQTLTALATTASLQEIIRQMKVAGATIQAQTVAGTTTGFTGEGNGAVNISVRRPNGLVQENAYAETILLTCTADSFRSGVLLANETFRAGGQGQQSDRFAYNWPLGSGATASLQAIDGNTDNGSGNLLTNSGFADFTSNAPDNYTIVAGTAGTNLFEETTLVYDNGSALRLVGDASGTLTNLTQTFDNSSGTNGELDASTQYSFNVYARRDGTAPAAGVLTVDLIDGSNVVIQDDQGANNSFTIDLTGLTTSYAPYTGVFRIPASPPATIKLRLRLTTALTDGRSVYFDKMSMGLMTRLYSGGPYLAIHSGNNPFVLNDYASATVTNDRGGQTNLTSFGPLLERFFQLSTLDLLFPSSSTPTIPDSLIT